MKHGPNIKRVVVSPFHILLLTFTILVLMHNVTTPVFEAPDEVWHYNYVRWLAEGHGLPSLENDRSGANQEAAQPPLYYILAALLSKPFADDDLQSLFWQNPGFGFQAPGTSPDNKNMLIHTSRENFPWQGAVAAIHAARFTSLIFGIWTLVAAWYLGQEVFQNRKSALIFTSVLAFHPQFVFMCSVVSNDSATAALCTTALYTIVRTIRKQDSIWEIVFCGLTVGAAALSKTSAVLLLPLGGIALIYDGVQKKYPFVDLLKRLVIFGGCVLLAGGWWYGRNTLLYGDPMGFASHLDTPWGRSTLITYFQLLPEIPVLIRSFWAAYGWGHVTWPDVIPYLLTGFSSVFFIWGLADIFRFRSRIDQETAGHRQYLWLAFGWLILVTVALLSWMRQVEAPHGRLLFPAVGAWALILASGLTKAYHKVGNWRRLATLFLGLMAALCALAPGARILPAFARPRLTNTPDLLTVDSATVLTFGDVARVFDVSIEKGYRTPGDMVRVRACWQALKAMPEDYTVFVHLIGPQNVRAAERHTYPGLGRYPTSLWKVGSAFCDNYDLQVEDWAPTPVLYNLEIGLFESKTGERLAATNLQGQDQEPPIVGTVPVVAETYHHEAETPLSVTFGDQILLSGVDLPASGEHGQVIDVTLHWEALTKPEPGLKTFVHVWLPGTDEPFAQDDVFPNQGWFPTDVWEKGIKVADTHRISLPADLEPGKYPLWAGLYRASDGTRLHAVGPSGPFVNALVPIGEIEIK